MNDRSATDGQSHARDPQPQARRLCYKPMPAFVHLWRALLASITGCVRKPTGRFGDAKRANKKGRDTARPSYDYFLRPSRPMIC
jgi:hypothetical protein